MSEAARHRAPESTTRLLAARARAARAPRPSAPRTRRATELDAEVLAHACDELSARSEWPPNSKKSSCTPAFGVPSTARHGASNRSSSASRGGVDPRGSAVVGTVRVLRIDLAVALSGRSSSATSTLGTSAAGKRSSKKRRSSAGRGGAALRSRSHSCSHCRSHCRAPRRTTRRRCSPSAPTRTSTAA